MKDVLRFLTGSWATVASLGTGDEDELRETRRRNDDTERRVALLDLQLRTIQRRGSSDFGETPSHS